LTPSGMSHGAVTLDRDGLPHFGVNKTPIWMSAINPASFVTPSAGLQLPGRLLEWVLRILIVTAGRAIGTSGTTLSTCPRPLHGTKDRSIVSGWRASRMPRYPDVGDNAPGRVGNFFSFGFPIPISHHNPFRSPSHQV
jgi:hypothetical protein